MFGYLGQNDPAPMTAPVPFGMNSSSSQLLDLLQALRLGQFFFFPSLTSRLPVKKIYYIAQTFQTQLPTSPIKNPKPRHHSRAKVMLQKMVLEKQCWSVAVEDNVVAGVLKQCCRRRCWSGVAENAPPKKLVHLWQVSVHQHFFLFAYFSLLFFVQM